MKTRFNRRSFIALSVPFAVSVRSVALATVPQITVFAAASLREAFEAAAPSFTAATNTTVTYNFAGSDTLVAQIAQGAPVDVFASANTLQMQKLVNLGLAASTPVVFAQNRLVVILPKANPGKIQSIADLARTGVKVVLAASAVPVGAYARTAFSRLDGSNGFPAHFAAAVESNVVSNELDVKAVATKIALGEGDAGVVYVTDITPTLAANVVSLPFPPGIAPNAIYPIVALKAAPNPAGAKAFIEFLLHNGQRFLEARSFLAP